MDLPAAATNPPPRLTMRAFWQELGEGMFNLERGLPWTFWRMLRAPGALIRDFIVTRDPRIVRPVRWFLIGFAALALVFQLAGGAEAAYTGYNTGADNSRTGAAETRAIWWVMTQIQWLLLISVVPAGAAGLGKAFKRETPDFAEMWVFCLYVGGQAMLLATVLVVLEFWLGVANVALAIPLLPPVLYVAAAVGYFRMPLLASLPRALLALAIAVALTLLFLMASFFAAMTVARQIA